MRGIAETYGGASAPRSSYPAASSEACEEVAKAVTAQGRLKPPSSPATSSAQTRGLGAGREGQPGLAYGRIDILVCNAAVNPSFGPNAQLHRRRLRQDQGANVKSNLWLCNLTIPVHGGARPRRS